MILTIAGNPTRHYYRDPAARAYVPAKDAAHQLLESVGTLRSTATGEPPNMTCTLRPGALALMILPPLGAVATISDAGVTLHTGRVVAIDWTPAGLTVELQS